MTCLLWHDTAACTKAPLRTASPAAVAPQRQAGQRSTRTGTVLSRSSVVVVLPTMNCRTRECP